MNPDWIPSKAEAENPDDCFGKYASAEAPECQKCIVFVQCASLSLGSHFWPGHHVDVDFTDVTNSPSIFRSGTISYWAHVLILAMPKEFSIDDLRTAFRIRLSVEGIISDNQEKALQKVISELRKQGVLKKTSTSTYERLVV